MAGGNAAVIRSDRSVQDKAEASNHLFHNEIDASVRSQATFLAAQGSRRRILAETFGDLPELRDQTARRSDLFRSANRKGNDT